MTNYLNTGILDYRELPLFLFFILLIPIISNQKNVLIYCFLIGSLSLISILWGIDRGAYLNATLFAFLIFLLIGKKYKKGGYIILGIIISWSLFYTILSYEV